MPVQLPLAHSGWLFKEENEEPDVKPWLAGPKEQDMEVDVPVVKGSLCQVPSQLFCGCPPGSRPRKEPPRLLLVSRSSPLPAGMARADTNISLSEG